MTQVNAGFDLQQRKELITLYAGMALQGLLAGTPSREFAEYEGSIASSIAPLAVSFAVTTVNTLEAELVKLESKLAPDGSALVGADHPEDLSRV